MQKKSFLLFLKNYQPMFQIGKKNVMKKWLNFAVNKKITPKKYTLWSAEISR